MPQSPQIDPNHIFPESTPEPKLVQPDEPVVIIQNADPFAKQQPAPTEVLMATSSVVSLPQGMVLPLQNTQNNIQNTSPSQTQNPQPTQQIPQPQQVQYIQAPNYDTQNYQNQNYPQQTANQPIANYVPEQNTNLPQQYYQTDQQAQNSEFEIGQPQPQAQTTKNPNLLGKKVSKFTNILVKKWYLFVAVALGIGVFFVGLFSYFNQPKIPTGPFDNVTAVITAPSTSPAGSPTKWKVTISNKENSALQNVNLQLYFDKSFKFTSAINPDPIETNPSGYLYKIPSLDAFGSKSSSEAIIQFEGVLAGQIDEDTVMRADLTYTPTVLAGTTNAKKTGKVEAAKTRITSPEIKVDLNSPNDMIQNGGETEVIANISNTSERDLRDLRIRMVYPDKGSFNYVSSEFTNSNGDKKTNPDNGQNEWILTTLPRLKEQTLRVKGNIYGQDGVKVTFRVEVDVRTTSKEYQTLVKTSKDISIQSQPLTLSARIDGKDNSKIFAPGETLNFVIGYQNQSTNTLKNVDILGFVEDPADILDYNTMAFVGGDRGNVTNRSVLWQGNNIPQLVNLTPQVKGELRFTIKVKENENFIKTDRPQNNYVLTPKATAKAVNLQNVEIAGGLYKASGQLQFTQETKDLGTDPSNVSKKRYQVIWTLKSRQSNINSVVVNTRSGLPVSSWKQGTVKPDSASPQINYDKSTGQITWSPGRIPAYSGIGTNLGVSVTFTLETDNGGSELFNAPQITGIDDFSGEKYTLTGPAAKG